MRRGRVLVLLPLLLLAGCLGGDDETGRATALPPEPTLTGAATKAAAPATAGTLARVADTRESRRRLAYVNLTELSAVRLPVARTRLLRRVLGSGADVVSAQNEAAAAVQVGERATVLYAQGRPRIVGAGAELTRRLSETAPETSAITPLAVSAVQSCLGDTVAQSILGPEAVGFDAALGAGLAQSGDAPAGWQLRICGAPRYVRHVHAMEQALERRFGDTSSRIGEQEIGEREIVSGVIAARELPRGELLRLVAAGPVLRSLAWR